MIPIVPNAPVRKLRSKSIVKLAEGKHEVFIKEKENISWVLTIRTSAEY